MNTHQLLRVLQADVMIGRNHHVQVLPRDQLPEYIDPTKPAAFILNTDPGHLPGTHWTALYYDGLGKFEYFDSFGLPPRHPDIVNFIERNSNVPFVYNPRAIQDIRSLTCGLYAVYFLLVKSRGGSLQRVLMPFSGARRQYINDRIVWRLVRHLFIKAGLKIL